MEVMMKKNSSTLKLKWLGINTYKENVIYMHKDCHICRSEGFEAQTRIQIAYKDRTIIATLNIIESDLLKTDEASLSNYAWDYLEAKTGEQIQLSHPEPLTSLSYIHSKIYGNELSDDEIDIIIKDVLSGRLSDVHISAFLASCAGGRLNEKEILDMTKSMAYIGEHLKWPSDLIVDKHCVGGLPGNRTSMVVVPIVTAFGLTMPKTSSRSITSPSGTADTMEVLAPVNLTIHKIRKVVEKENGCIVWGGSIALSPSDDILIRVERAIDLDSEGQLVASIISKKFAAGSTHIVIDIPIGPTAKVRSLKTAILLKKYLEKTGESLGIKINVIFTDGLQPVGRGIGPALEAKDVIEVLLCAKNAPLDLRDRSLTLAGKILEFSADVKEGAGKQIATEILDTGQAWKKFQAICHAQGGLYEIPISTFKHVVEAKQSGKIVTIDNRRIARVAKLAGAPHSKAAGVELLTPLTTQVQKGEPLFIIHAQTRGEMEYAINYVEREAEVIQIEEV